MEMLKALIPGEMRRRIYEGNADDLPSTCSSLIEFFRPLPQFQQVVRELSDPVLWMCGKDRESAAAMKEKGNVSFRNGDYPGALQSYTKKMGLFEESVRDCNRALVLFTCYGKAWYQRGRANLSLWNHSCNQGHEFGLENGEIFCWKENGKKYKKLGLKYEKASHPVVSLCRLFSSITEKLTATSVLGSFQLM